MFRSPFTKKCRITTAFKKKGKWACGYHTGIDLVPVDGDSKATLVAPCDCTIISVNGCGSSYGNHICAKSGNYVFIMAHMRYTPLVKKGQKVKKGQQVGVMGNTGNSFGAHLHIEFEKASSWSYAKNLVNPLSVMDINDFSKKLAPKPKYGNAAMAKAQTVYADSDLTIKVGTVSNKERVYHMGTGENNIMICYQTSNGYKVGFVKKGTVVKDTGAIITSKQAQMISAKTAYADSKLTTKIGSVSKKEKVTYLGSGNGNTIICYKTTKGYKVGFVAGGSVKIL